MSELLSDSHSLRVRIIKDGEEDDEHEDGSVPEDGVAGGHEALNDLAPHRGREWGMD